MKAVKKGMVLAVMALCAGLAFVSTGCVSTNVTNVTWEETEQNPFLGTKWSAVMAGNKTRYWNFNSNNKIVDYLVHKGVSYIVKTNGTAYMAVFEEPTQDATMTLLISDWNAKEGTQIVKFGYQEKSYQMKLTRE